LGLGNGRFHEKKKLPREIWLRSGEKALWCQDTVEIRRQQRMMSSMSMKERDKKKSKARIEQNIGGPKKFKGSRDRP